MVSIFVHLQFRLLKYLTYKVVLLKQLLFKHTYIFILILLGLENLHDCKGAIVWNEDSFYKEHNKKGMILPNVSNS